MRALFCLLACVLAPAVLAQAPDAPAGPPEEMGALSFLVGDWEGEGWIVLGTGERHDVVQTERITALLGGEVLLIEGRGVAADDTSRVVHEAVAFIGYDPEVGAYAMRTFLTGGRGAEPEVEVTDGALVWQIGSGVRYTIRLNEEGQWYEVGEYSGDGGKSWSPFFEMTLDRVE